MPPPPPPPSQDAPPRIVLSHSTQDTRIRRNDSRSRGIDANDDDNLSQNSNVSNITTELSSEIPTGLALTHTVTDPFNYITEDINSNFDNDTRLSSLNLNINSSPNKRHSRNRSTDSHKRLSIFTVDSDQSTDDLRENILGNISHFSTKARSKDKGKFLKEPSNSNPSPKLSPKNRNKKKLKLTIPDSNAFVDGEDLHSSEASFNMSPMPKTPANLKKGTMEDDLNHVLNDALFNSAWMPVIEGKSTKRKPPSDNSNTLLIPNHPNNSYSSNDSSSTNIRHRNKNRNSSDSFNHDLEANASIPLVDLNFQNHNNTPKLHMDSYMTPSFTTKNHSQSSFLHVPQEVETIDSNHSSVRRGYYESAADQISSSGEHNTEENEIKTKASNVTKIFAKISNLVNADTIDSDDDLDDIYQLSSNVHKIKTSEIKDMEYDDEYPNIELTKDKRNSMMMDSGDTQDSIIRVYLETLTHENNNENGDDSTVSDQNDDIISVLNPFASENISRNESLTPTTSIESGNEDNISSDDDGLESRLYGKTLKTFSSKSKLRQTCYRVLSWKFTNQFITCLIFSQVVMLSYQQWKVEYGYFYAKKYTSIDWILFVYNIIFTFEMITKIIAFGFYDDSQMIEALRLVRYESKLQTFYFKLYGRFKKTRFYSQYNRLLKREEKLKAAQNPFSDDNAISKKTKKHLKSKSKSRSKSKPDSNDNTSDLNNKKSHIRYAYLRTDWNRVDFVSIISFWISFFLSFDYERMKNAKVFRALMCLRILRLLNISRGSRVVLRGLKESAMQSKDVLLFLVCFWVLFAIIGVESFQSSLRRQCVWQNPNNEADTYLNAFQFCGSYLEPGTLKILPYLKADGTSSGIAKGFACPVNSKCILGDNPYGGRVSFDNIVNSMQSVFVIISANTFTDLMYYTMDSDSMVASLFFISSIFVLVVWLLNLFIAVIIHSYDVEGRSKNEKESWYAKHAKLYDQFVENSKFVKYLKKVDFLFVDLIVAWFTFSCTKERVNGEFHSSYQRGDFIVSILLLCEIFIRIGVFILDSGFREFFYSLSNNVDLFLAISSFVFSLSAVQKNFDSITNGYLSFFGILRFYRVVVSIKPIRQAWELAFTKTRPFAELVYFGATLLFLVSIIMSRLFEGIVPESEMEENPWIMYNLPNCIVSLFIITTTENWTETLYSTEEYASVFDSICVAVFLIAWFILSNTVILSIFIAIITDNLKIPDSEKKVIQIKQFIKSCINKTRMNNEGLFDIVINKFNRNADFDEANHFLARMNEILVSNGHDPIDVEEYSDEDRPMRRKFKALKRKFKKLLDSSENLKSIKRSYRHLKALAIHSFQKYILRRENQTQSTANFNHGTSRGSADLEIDPFISKGSGSDDRNSGEYNDSEKPKRTKIDRSLLVFTNENPIRRFCQMFVAPKIPRKEGRQPAPRLMYCFNVFVFLASVTLVVLVCYETPLYRTTKTRGESYSIWMMYPDITLMVIFTLEFFIKIIADGLIIGDRSYFQSIWNILDFIVLMSLWVTVIAVVNDKYTDVVAFDALKAIRVFRLLTITNESQMIFHFAIVSGMYKILSAAMVSLSLLVPFALWGLNIFNGELSYCADGVSTLGNCTLEFKNEVFQWNILSPNYVETPYLQFDSFASSLRSLFEILSLEGWVDLLGNVMNITKYGEQPSIFASPGYGAFVVIFIFCAVVFILNLFISIIINNYTLQTGIAYLSNEQYGWYEVKKVLSKVKPSRRRDEAQMSRIQKKVFEFINKKRGVWSKFITLVLAIHFLVLLSEAYPDTSFGPIVRNSFYLCTSFILLLHMILMLYCVGFKVFLSNRLNATMSIILVAAVVMAGISIKHSTRDTFYNIYKVLVVLILGMIIPRVDALNQLIKYGSSGLFSLVALLYTWLVLFLDFAIALNQVFGLTRLGPNTNGNLNARTVTKALIMLFRNSFGEGWNYIAQDFTVEGPYCYAGPYGNSDCGNYQVAFALFIMWNIISMYIFLNILISVVVNNFSYVYHGSGPHKLITRDEIRRFKISWNKYDLTGTGYIYERDLFKFLHSLDGVLSYHVYPKYLSLPIISEKVLSGKNPTNSYDFQINTTKLKEILSMIDFPLIRQRRIRYDRLVSELLDSAVVIATENNLDGPRYIRKIPFEEAILAIGYYSRFEDSTCLTLEDFLRHSAQMRMISRELRKAKILSTIKMIFTRLRYKYYVDKVGIFDKIQNAPNALEKERIKDEFRRKLKGVDISFDILMDSVENEEDVLEDNPIFNDNLYRVMSQSSQNPFRDAYEARMNEEEEFNDSALTAKDFI